MKKALSIISMVLAIAMMLVACGTPASGTAGSSSKGDASKAVTIRMIESLTSPERTAVLREIADKFEAENSGVKIEIISPPLEGADQKIAQMLQQKQPLDIVEVREQTLTQFANNGWIADLDKYLKDWDGYKTLTDAAKNSITEMSGKAYLIPYGFYQRILFYRADWFKEAGLQPPTTWEGILEAGKKLTDPSKNRYGYSFRGGKGGNQYISMEIWGNLGTEKVVNSTNAFFLKDGGTVFSTKEAEDALNFHKKLYEECSPKDSVAWGFSEMVQGFIGGTTAMLIQDPEVIAMCEKDMKPGTWATQVMPAGKSGQAIFPNGYAGWGMTSYSENPDMAAKFLLFLSNEENNTYFAKKYSTIPIHSTAAEKDSFFKEGAFASYMEMAKRPETFRFLQSPQAYEAFAEYNTTCDEYYQKFLNGTMSAKETLSYFDKYWSDALAKEGKKW